MNLDAMQHMGIIMGNSQIVMEHDDLRVSYTTIKYAIAKGVTFISGLIHLQKN